MAGLAFLPWARLTETVETNGAQLIPYVREREPFGHETADQRSVDAVMNWYRQNAKRPISSAVLIKRAGHGVLDTIDA